MHHSLGSVNPVTDELIRAMKLTEDTHQFLQTSFGGRHIRSSSHAESLSPVFVKRHHSSKSTKDTSDSVSVRVEHGGRLLMSCQVRFASARQLPHLDPKNRSGLDR